MQPHRTNQVGANWLMLHENGDGVLALKISSSLYNTWEKMITCIMITSPDASKFIWWGERKWFWMLACENWEGLNSSSSKLAELNLLKLVKDKRWIFNRQRHLCPEIKLEAYTVSQYIELLLFLQYLTVHRLFPSPWQNLLEELIFVQQLGK